MSFKSIIRLENINILSEIELNLGTDSEEFIPQKWLI